ncbi:Tryptophan 2-monooxygenase [Carbonactinospora thermoautotrophica]|uniref:Tryptophan 2-monooxygenase n=1 Tax=Carbonactinospora thermoautotrophica TaxID=1469144 RepID=A0A132MU06_9ACTN|nr:NAD(P)/FAD-dependent oxidoreductase [Carbonactinospora thermoautotrophica]KWX00852.1 Tryptophan 2-monooxygenase [Carbonactinospora thermoautotrophica]
MASQLRITIIGAGVAGLVAAYELEQLGHQVEILEGSSRIGGRIYTHRFGSDASAPFVELGAMRIPSHHRNTLSYIHQLGLDHKLETFKTLFSDAAAYHFTDAGFVRLRHAAQVLVEEFRARLAGDGYRDEEILFGTWLTAIGNAIAPANFRDSIFEDISLELLKLVKGIDLTPFLRGDHKDRFDLHGFFAAYPHIRSSSSGRLNRFIDDILNETSPDLLRLAGGMDQLVRALAERIRGPIRCGHEVVGLAVRDHDVLVDIRQGDHIVTKRCDYVLCTIPFSLLRRLRLCGFSEEKLAVIRNVQYWSATKVAFLCAEPFWVRDGIDGGASFIGGRVRQTYYPPVEGDPDRGAVLLASYTMGDDADVIGGMDPSRRHAVVLHEVSRMHPELLAPGMVRDVVSLAWGQHRWSCGGGVTRWGKDAAACEEERALAARPEKRLFFAGEHCSSTTAWMEGAIESAIHAVREITRDEPRTPVAVARHHM